MIRVATDADREAIYRLRHRVYAEELGQHAVNAQEKLTDSLDSFNTYIVGEVGGEIAGFISITPPQGPSYSIDKYFQRDDVPLSFDDGLYELRLLTVVARHRQGPLAGLLMREAFRWVRDHGGRWIVIIGRRELVDLYRKVGMKPLGKSVRSGAVTFDLMAAAVEDLDAVDHSFAALSARLNRMIETKPGLPKSNGLAESAPAAATPCDHGARRSSRPLATSLTAWIQMTGSSTRTCWTPGLIRLLKCSPPSSTMCRGCSKPLRPRGARGS